MDDAVKRKERELERLSVEEDVTGRRLGIAEKKALIREAKRKYGRDWKKMIGGALKSIRPDQETVQDLYSMGVGGSELRDMNNPYKMGRRRNGDEG